MGYDAILLDGEHGIMGTREIDGLVALSKALGLQVYCRVATAERPQVQQALDAGADALVLPQIRDHEEARAASELSKYPPLGTRGMGSPRSLNYRDTPDDFVLAENRRTRCFVMIETPGAFQDVEAIAAMPTVDGLFMGPYDLSLTRGRGQYARTKADEVDAGKIAAAAKAAGKLLGVPAFSEQDVALALRYGAHIITIGDDVSMLTESLGSNYRRVRALLDRR